MLKISKIQRLSSYRGFTLSELLVGLLMSSALMLAVAESLTSTIHASTDQKLRTVAQLQAQGMIDTIIPELRMLGNGVPFHQANFLIAQAGLADNTVTQPILVAGTTANQVQFRLNQTGETYILMTDYDPVATNTVALTSVDKIYVGDEIYITNATVGLDDGLWGVVSSINTGTNEVTFASGYQYSNAATFPKGSLFEVVPIITYTSGVNYGAVTRDDGNGAVNLLSNGKFTLEFLNSDGDPITLPLVASSADPFPDEAIQNVRAIRVTVEVQSPSPLTGGNYYYATAEQTVGIRNLNFKY